MSPSTGSSRRRRNQAARLVPVLAFVLAGCSGSSSVPNALGPSTAAGTTSAPAPGAELTGSTPTVTKSASAPTTKSLTGTPITPSGTPIATPSTTPSTTPSGTTTKPPRSAGGQWRPAPGTAWQWQLTGALDTGVDVPVYDVDLYTTSSAEVATLHAAGRRVICYVNVGAYEDFRPDKGAFPASVLGSQNGWPGERWLDIRRLDVLVPLMGKRLDLCRQKGFDAVEPDNVDGYANDSGFDLSADQQLAYNRAIASLAHARGLSVGLKNDLDQIPQLVASFDFAVNEQCFEYSECDALAPFVSAGKAAFTVEYSGSTSAFCPQARRQRLSSMLKHLSLDAWRQPC